jgi:hypothetical protein
VLFLNPNDEKARQTVQKWEFLSADEYDDELFAMKPVFKLKERPAEKPARETPEAPLLQPVTMSPQKAKTLERATSLADAFTIRGDFEKAVQVLFQARTQIGPATEIERRLELLAKRAAEMNLTFEELTSAPEPEEDEDRLPPLSDPNENPAYRLDPKEEKRQKLEAFLRRIEARRLGS